MSNTPRCDEFWNSLARNNGELWALARQLEREITALRESQMTEAKAREVLGEWIWRDEINGAVIEKGNLHFSENQEVVNWMPWQHHPDKVNLLGTFTSLKLRAIAFWMDNMGGAR